MKRAEILLYGNIGSDWWSDGMSAANFRSLFSAAERDDTIEGIDIRINSPGGYVSDGIAIYNTIASSKKEVHTYIDGIAYSMGAIIALAGDKVFMANNATMLLHNAWGLAVGNASDMEQTVETLKAMDTGLIASVSDKTGMSEDEVKKKWFDYKDHTFSAKDALSAKLVDEVIDRKADVPDNLANMTEAELFAHYSKMGKGEKESFWSRMEKKISDSFEKLTNNVTKTTTNMKVKIQSKWAALAAALSVAFAAGETEKDFELQDSHLEKLDGDLKELKGLKDSVTAKDTEIAALKAEVAELKKEPAARTPKPQSKKEGDGEDNEEEIPMDSVTLEAIKHAEKYGNKFQEA